MRARKVVGISLGVAIAVAAGGMAVLPAVARFLEAWEPLEPADYIALFAGDYTVRPVHAARLYHQGYAKELVTTGEFVADEICALGLEITGAELSAIVLQENGVPPERIHVLSSGYSTLEEARAFAKFIRRKSLDNIIVVTSPYHVRRAKFILRQELEGRGVKVMGSAAHNGSGSKWWRTKGGLVHLNNELLKLVFHELPSALRDLILDNWAQDRSGRRRRLQCPPA